MTRLSISTYDKLKTVARKVSLVRTLSNDQHHLLEHKSWKSTYTSKRKIRTKKKEKKDAGGLEMFSNQSLRCLFDMFLQAVFTISGSVVRSWRYAYVFVSLTPLCNNRVHTLRIERTIEKFNPKIGSFNV